MQITVKHVQKRGNAEWRYRRKVPQELRDVVGKREILIPLGSFGVSSGDIPQCGWGPQSHRPCACQLADSRLGDRRGVGEVRHVLIEP